MQCQICNKTEATIHVTEIVNGQRAEMHLCSQCAEQQGIAVKSQIPINELLSNLLAVQPTDSELFGLASEEKLSCPKCGLTLEQFRKQAALGCPDDYKVFEKSLLPLIKKAHDGKTNHCGKIPSKMPADTKKEMEISNMQQQLNAALKREDYELAAKLRDKISEKFKMQK